MFWCGGGGSTWGLTLKEGGEKVGGGGWGVGGWGV